MSSSTSHKIKSRTTGNDVFITPRKLAKLHIDMIPEKYHEGVDFSGIDPCWLDPCKNDGSYYDQFPDYAEREYCEILEDNDFFKWESGSRGPQVIIGNPPYSILDAWLKHTLECNPDCFSYLIGQGALTTRRMEWIEMAGYTITRLHLTKVYKWYGMSYIVVCEKGLDLPQKITMDRTVWREDPKPEPVPKALDIKLKITIDKPVEKEQKCWTCGDTDVQHKTYRDALDEDELTCNKCHRIEYPEEYEMCDDENRCEACTHCARTKVCDTCNCVGGCENWCKYNDYGCENWRVIEHDEGYIEVSDAYGIGREGEFMVIMNQLTRELWFNGNLWESANIAEHIVGDLYNPWLNLGLSEGWIIE